MNEQEDYLSKSLGLSGELISAAARHFDRFKMKAADEIFYEYVGLEISEGYKNQGLYIKCFSECEGEERKTEAKYIRERVKQVKLVFLKAQREAPPAKTEQPHPPTAAKKKEPQDPYAKLSLDEKIKMMKEASDIWKNRAK